MRDRPAADTVAVVVPNWNGADHLPACLDAIASLEVVPDEVIVVDNGSTDGSLKLLEENYPWARVIALATNEGFSAAVNAGIASTSAASIALLNNDARVDPAWLGALIAALGRHEDASFAASKIVLEGSDQLDSAGHGFDLLRAKGVDRGRGERAALFAQPAWVFGAPAAAAIYRRSLFEDIGLFDEDFFLTYEDVDLDMRAQIAGHRCLYVPDATVHHRRGASHDPTSPALRAIAIRNRVLVAGKSLPPALLVIAALGAIALAAWEAMTVAVRTLRRRGPAGASGVEETRLLITETARGIRSLPAKRALTRRLARVGAMRLIRSMSAHDVEWSHRS